MKFARLSENKKTLLLTDSREIPVDSKLYPLMAQPDINRFFETVADLENLMGQLLAVIDTDPDTIISENLLGSLACAEDRAIGLEKLARCAINTALGTRVPCVVRYATREFIATDKTVFATPTIAQLGHFGFPPAKYGKDLAGLGKCLPMFDSGTSFKVRVVKPASESSENWIERVRAVASRLPDNDVVIVDGEFAFFQELGSRVDPGLVASYTGRLDSSVILC